MGCSCQTTAFHTCSRATLIYVKQDIKRNITFSLSADLIGQAKVLAAKRESSVNAIVADLLRKELEKGQEERMAVAERILARASKVKIKILRSKNAGLERVSTNDDEGVL